MSKRKAVWVAEYESRHYTWRAYGTTDAEVNAAFRALIKDAIANADAMPEFMDEAMEEVHVDLVELGCGYCDGRKRVEVG